MTAEEMFKKLGYDRHEDDFCGIKSLFYEKQNEFNDIIIIKFKKPGGNSRLLVTEMKAVFISNL